jgi:hypothetical protein
MMIPFPYPILLLPFIITGYGLFKIYKAKDKPIEDRVFFASLFFIMLLVYFCWFGRAYPYLF